MQNESVNVNPHAIKVKVIPEEFLDFFPDYAGGVHTKKKTYSFRLGDKYAKRLKPGMRILLTELGVPVTSAIVTNVRLLPLRFIKVSDLQGSEFSNINSLMQALTEIYVKSLRVVRELTLDNIFTVINWRYED